MNSPVLAAAILAGAIVIASVPGWHWMVDRQRPAGARAQAECLSLTATYRGEENPFANLEHGLYKNCLLHRLGVAR